MPPRVASVVFVLGILALFRLDRDTDERTSPALWIPVAWMAIGASRNLSEWFATQGPLANPDQYLEGSPFDRLLFSGLLAAALMVLFARGRASSAVLQRNWMNILFLLYCLASAAWSDFPLVSFKRWTKALGNFSMVLVVLTDPNPKAAVKRLLALTGFMLIPASVLLVKYYPEIGRQYDRWIGTAYYSGVASDKNGLGYNCLIFGLASVWRVVNGLQATVRKNGQLIAHVIILGMVLWLLRLANSSTSLACFLLGSSLIIFLSMAKVERPAMVHTILASVIAAAAVAFMARDVFSYLVSSLGRDTTLTGRTPLWEQLLKMNDAHWFGTGFESFFLGKRAEMLWAMFTWHPNEAHNGYLELYLNLGVVGLGLFLFVIVVGYRNVVHTFRSDRTSATLKLAFLIAALIYNSTEAAFKVMHPVWIVFLFAITAVPNPAAGTTVVPLPSAAPTPVPSRWSASRSPRWRREASS